MPFPRLTAAGALLTAAVLASGCAQEAATQTGAVGSVATPAAPTPTPTPDRSGFVAAVDALAADALEHGPIAGLSIAVFERGQPVVAKGYGFADLEAVVPASADTSYPIASVSKNFTAALILRLAQEGRLALDDPLSRFFPAARPRIGALTLRHLLDHTSGITKGGPAPRHAALSVLKRGGTARDQGEAWDYTNYNFSLLGLVIEEVSGRDYAAYLHDTIVVPLGLNGTGYCEDGTALPGRGRDYLSSPRRVAVTDYWSKPRFFAAGGLCSTVLDLVRWDQALEDGRVIDRAMLEVMRTPARLPESLQADYGLGTRMGLTGALRKVGHTGGGQGNKAVVARYPDQDVTIVVLLNTERANAPITANEMEERIARLLFGLPAVDALPAAPPPEDLQRYAGEYRESARLVRITATFDALTARPGFGRRAESRFVATGGGVFVAEDDPSIALRFQVRDDQMRGYTRYRHGWFSGLAVRTPATPATATPGG